MFDFKSHGRSLSLDTLVLRQLAAPIPRVEMELGCVGETEEGLGQLLVRAVLIVDNFMEDAVSVEEEPLPTDEGDTECKGALVDKGKFLSRISRISRGE